VDAAEPLQVVGGGETSAGAELAMELGPVVISGLMRHCRYQSLGSDQCAYPLPQTDHPSASSVFYFGTRSLSCLETATAQSATA
jgi:hypothetical protein